MKLRSILAGLLLAGAAALSLYATSVIPISDRELSERADVIVHGIVVSSDVTVDGDGRPETLSVIEPLEVLKGRLRGPLVLHQLGGHLPDGRGLQIWGRPEYVPGHEVIVFAIRRTQGEYQTAEMLLGKFDVETDERGLAFAVPALWTARHGVTVHERLPRTIGEGPLSTDPPRELGAMLRSLRAGAAPLRSVTAHRGTLTPVVHATSNGPRLEPEWGNISNTLTRWNNNATATWQINNTANITGGGMAEALGALAAWTDDPHSNINYTAGSPSGNTIDLNAMSVCGYSGCLAGGGVIGCGGPSYSGSHTWRGETYFTAVSGFAQLRSYCTFNLYSSATTQAVITHELGHTLGLGHSDQNVSVHDTCRGDEGSAQMRSVVQGFTALGTDDQDAIRWLYGDGLTSCGVQPAPTVASVTPSFGPVAGGTVVTIVGTNFVSGATVAFGAAAGTGVVFVSATTLRATTPAAGGPGAVGVAVTNPDAQAGSLPNAFTYNGGVGFYSVTPCRVIDTRNATGPYGGPALAAGADRTFVFANQCGIPAGAKGIALNVAVTQPTAGPGFLTFYPVGAPLPATATINYNAGHTRANNASALLGPGTDLVIHCGQSSGTVHVVVDVTGYFQ